MLEVEQVHEHERRREKSRRARAKNAIATGTQTDHSERSHELELQLETARGEHESLREVVAEYQEQLRRNKRETAEALRGREEAEHLLERERAFYSKVKRTDEHLSSLNKMVRSSSYGKGL